MTGEIHDRRVRHKIGGSLYEPKPRIFDLCCGSGAWSKPYTDAGYDVVLIDIQHGDDVRLLKAPLLPVHGVLAAPPCTVFAHAGNHVQRFRHEVLEALSVVDACLRFIAAARPVWWALENPMGKLTQWIGQPVMRFQPCDYGDPWTKQTQLWGNFNTALPANPVVPTEGSKFYKRTGGGDRSLERAVTPPGFANAFFKANP